ncbi:TPA: LOW QUALITY PROTEIN: hypothetical protein N0F65_006017 [Lagenidium giganteum]|uniref:Uncharacterized protein n=1 Tax=Lagenidium giganteum TaxID=4803 RepID=A0AAV2Z766_9STRA|nr:TPA: LOW QUALITY PROTEIN: hypothetical protein N0F65_006017 [Lagenidium giganteum]
MKPEKHAKAFGNDVKAFMDGVSATSGVLGRSDNQPCKDDSECGGMQCGIRDAALFEPEPQCSVEKHGVTFNVLDIKGLISQVYNGASVGTVFTGARYDGDDDSRAVDSFGRFTDAARRDLGPGDFHIAFSNIMGKHGKSFVIDTSADAPVWNQPVRSYNVKTVEYYSPEEAASKYFGGRSYPFNDKAKNVAYVATDIAWIFERDAAAPYVPNRVDEATHYVLELDDNDQIIGGEWLGDSRAEHPDFLWFPTSKAASDTVTTFGLANSDVQELLKLSVACGATPDPTAPPTPTPSPTPKPSSTPELSPASGSSSGSAASGSTSSGSALSGNDTSGSATSGSSNNNHPQSTSL